MKVKASKNDKKIIQDLMYKKALIANSDNNNKKPLWVKLNMLNMERPPVWINEIPWNEMNQSGELEIKTENPVYQIIEENLRKTIYKWENMPADMVVEDSLFVPPRIGDLDFGLQQNYDHKVKDPSSDVVSKKFKSQIKNVTDLEKIKSPDLNYNETRFLELYQDIKELGRDIIKVKKGGISFLWFAPMDELARLWGVEKLYLDLYERPKLVHQGMKKMTEAYIELLNDLIDIKLLRTNNYNIRVGSGGYGYTEDLPVLEADIPVKPKQIWGSAAAQIFTSVSPSMHEEFALKYENKWLNKFGNVYYGCCEKLHNKINILRKIPNLRKISISPWANVEEAADKIGSDYVISYKPSPAIFARENFDLKKARMKLRNDLMKMKGCNVEIILKDISTIQYEPQRLWEWSKMAINESKYFAST